jgi:hypothetical protein
MKRSSLKIGFSKLIPFLSLRPKTDSIKHSIFNLLIFGKLDHFRALEKIFKLTKQSSLQKNLLQVFRT